MKKIFLLSLFLLPWAVHSAVKNIVPLSTAAQMQGGNSLPIVVPGSGYAVQANWTGSTLAGTIALQASLDNSNWFTIANSTQTVSGSGSFLWNVSGVGYPYTQLLYTVSSTNAWTVAPVADPGVAQIQHLATVADTCKTQIVTVSTKADVNGSLNNKYFLVSGMATGTAPETDYYVWFDINGRGTAPANTIPSLSGKTAVHITGVTGVTANAAAASIATALNALSPFSSATSSGPLVTVTANNCAALPAPTDGPSQSNSGTGFAFATVTAGVNSNLNNTYFTISGINSSTKAQKDYYVWYNVNSKGTDPLLAGKTAIPVALSATASANSVASATSTAIGAVSTSFSSTTSVNTVTATAAKVGAVPTAAEGAVPTGFTFFAPNTSGVNSLNNTYFTFHSANNATCYYLWINVDSLGTDPAVAGCTAAPITDTHGDSAGTIGAKIATAIAALNSTNDFTASGTTTVTTTNKASGPSTFPSDFGTGFTFTGTTGAGTLTSYISY